MEIELGDDKSNIDELVKFFKTSWAELKEKRKSILEKIQFWLDEVKNSNLSPKDKKQKTKEIIDLGNFLQVYNKDIIITSLGESPDFLIQEGTQRIGIELTDLVIRPAEKEKEGILKKLFLEIESEFRDEENTYKGIYRISFRDENQTFKKAEKENIKIEIINSIKHPEFPKTYIKEIRKTPHSKIHLYKGEATSVGHLERETLLDKIEKKETNFERYILKSTFDALWLLLIIGGVQKSDDYSFIDDKITKNSFITQFDKIFIFDFFRSEITELKTLKP